LEAEDVEERQGAGEKVTRYNKEKADLKGAEKEKETPLTITEGQLHRLKKTIEHDYYKLCTGKERDGGGSAYYNPYKSMDIEKSDGKI
jgi:hypothetical protein